jgi:hypothetical protein
MFSTWSKVDAVIRVGPLTGFMDEDGVVVLLTTLLTLMLTVSQGRGISTSAISISSTQLICYAAIFAIIDIACGGIISVTAASVGLVVFSVIKIGKTILNSRLKALLVEIVRDITLSPEAIAKLNSFASDAITGTKSQDKKRLIAKFLDVINGTKVVKKSPLGKMKASVLGIFNIPKPVYTPVRKYANPLFLYA